MFSLNTVIVILFLTLSIAYCVEEIRKNGKYVGKSEDRNLSKSSLVFVFDTTGSMHNDLKQLREGAEMILNTALEESNVIGDFVFVPFHDPVVGPATVTKDKQVFKAALDVIKVYGGGDCPEKSLGGIQLALSVSQPHSFVYVFTDATSGDHGLVRKVLDSIQRKQSQIIFVLTGHCNDLNKPSYKVYQQIAAASSGQIFNLNKTNVYKVLDFVRSSIRGKSVNLGAIVNPPGYNNTHGIPIDSTLGEVTVSVSGSKPKITVVNPKGEELTGPPKLVTTLDLSEIMVVKVLQPEPGNWTITTGSEDTYSVRVVGLSNLTFSHGFSVEKPKTVDETSYRPLLGAYNYMMISLSQIDQAVNITFAEILSLNGKTLFEISLKEMEEGKKIYITEPFIPPEEFFYIAINGVDENNQDLRRMGATAIQAKEPDKPYLTVPTKLVARLHESVLLRCGVESLVPVTGMWIKDGVRTQPQISSLQSTTFEYLVEEMNEGTAGAYSCVATNVAGQSVAYTEVELIVSPPQITMEPNNKKVQIGQNVTVTCSVNSEALLQKFEMAFNGSKRQYVTEMQVEPNIDGYYVFAKTVNYMSERDSGIYSCIASNRGGKSTVSTNITIESLPAVQIVGPHTISTPIYTDIQLVCHVENANRITWINPNDTIVYDRVINGSVNHMFSVENVEEDGVWSCIASRDTYRVTDTVFIEVQMKPKVFIEGPKNLTILNGTSHDIVCIVKAKPIPRIVWHKETEDFLNNTMTVLQPNVYKSVLTLNTLIDSVNRTYFCIGENPLGIDEDSISVNVRRKMVVLERFYDTVTDLYAQVEFYCQIDAHPPPKVKWYHNDTEIIQNDNVHITDGVLAILRVDFKDFGNYFCNASNGFEYITINGVLNLNYLETPELWKKPQSIIVREGDPIIITCSVINGKPQPELSWQFYSNINKLLSKLPSNVRMSDDQTKLIIPKVDKENSGAYKCLAENIVGEDFYEVSLVVKYPPQLVISNSTDIDKPTEVKAGQDVKFSCKSTGFPPPMVIWMKDQRPITYTAHTYLTDEHDLVVEKATEYDSGLYTCNVTSVLGSVQRNFKLIVYVPPMIISPEIEPELDILEGQLVELPCSVKGVPKPEIHWIQNGQPIPEARKYIDDFGIRFVANLTDFGNYTCEARNKYGNTSYTFSLYIWVAPYIEPPLLTSQNVVIGSNATLECNAIGFPLPTIVWKFDNELLEENYTDVSFNYVGNLFIYNVNSSHEGLYECVADNLAGSSTKCIYLIIDEPPTILQDNYTGSYIATDKDTSLAISCKTTGKPKPFVAWVKDNTFLDKDSRFDIDTDGTLTIMSPSEELSGFYTCIAKNQIAEVNRTTEVKIYSLPTFQSEESITTVKVLEKTNTTVKCPIPAATSDIVKWYKDAKLITAGDLKISNLTTKDTLTYVCKVTNLAGSATAKVLVDVEAPPSWLMNGDESIEAIKGDDLYFDCRVHAKPAAKTKWYFKSKLLLGADRERLKLMNVQTYQAGSYKCVVDNVHGTIAKEYSLTVLESPFISEFDLLDVQLKEGMNATLECKAMGTPEPNITWAFNNSNWYLQDTSLVATNLTISSEGLYRCDAENKAGSSHIVYHIIVIQSASVEEVVLYRDGIGETVDGKVELVLGSHVRVACKAKGKPTPTIQWIRSGNILSQSKENLYADLIIDNVQTNHNGIYLCVVLNYSGFDEKKIKIEVLEPPRIFKEVFTNSNVTENFTKIEVISGLQFYLHCHPNGNPLPDIYWFKDDLPLKLYDNTIVSKEFGEIIVIEKAKEENSGTYKCVARNKIGETSVSYLVDVLVPPPTPKESMRSVSTRFGRQLNLTCPVDGVPAPYVTWIKHPYTEIDENTPKFTLLGDNFTLLINKTEIIDSGKYSCIMTNKVGTSEVIFDVIIDKAPSIAGHKGDNVVENHVVPLRRSVVLKCQVDGNPAPSINWLKDTQQMNQNLSNIHQVLGNSILAVWSATSKVGGLYICVAENKAGVAQARYHISVQVPGKWSAWSQWSYCNVTCGLGHQHRTRYCQYIDDDDVIYDKNTKSDRIVLDESACKGLDTDKRKCHMPSCEEDTSQMRWSVWSKWSPCSVSCGVGTQTRTRRCKSETPCHGDNVQIRKCLDLPPCNRGRLNNKRDEEALDDLDPYSPEVTIENQPEDIDSNLSNEEENIPNTKYSPIFFNVNVSSNLGAEKIGPCGPGFKYNSHSKSCDDIDECFIEKNHCHSTQVCVNTFGGYSCTCPKGFVALGLGQRCLDINECEQGIHGCEFACVNVAGGYVCACPPNMRLHADRHRCYTPTHSSLTKQSFTEENTESYLSTTIDFPVRYKKNTRN